MMTGTVNPDLEPLLRLTVLDSSGQPHEVEALIDTGFNGFLTLPPTLIAALGLPWLCRQEGQLADGSVLVFDVYVATVNWHGQPRSVEVEAADAQPLLGMALMQGSDLHIQVVPGRPVTIAVLP
jgi:clan AA aspartic protease